VTTPDAEDSANNRPLSVEEHLRKALAYADAIRAIANLSAENENLPRFGNFYEVVDWIFETVQLLETHLRLVKGTLSFDCLNTEVTPPTERSASGGAE
jgi:hypothetical protein